MARGTYQAGGKYDEIIAELVKERGGGENSFLFQEMMTTALKLIDEKASRVDLKIMNMALKELRYAFKIFAPYRHIRKVSVFGSARTDKKAPEFQVAKQFGKAVVKKNFMVITGAASGIMEATNEGAGARQSFGVNIRLPHEQDANPVIKEDMKLVNFKYFFTRKLIFIKESDAIVLFPGGFGTHDEGFEALTLVQTGKSQPVPIIMMDHPSNPYWAEWDLFIRRQLLRTKYISPEDMSFYKITQNIDDAVNEIVKFYHNYDSCRFVGNVFVVRLKRAPKKLVDELNVHFKDILAPRGKYELVKAFPEEAFEGRGLELPRIAFPFNRRSYGRIRQLIDHVNQY